MVTSLRRTAAACLSIAVNWVSAAYGGQALPSVTMEDALLGNAPIVTNLQWLGPKNRLLASVRQSRDAAPALTLWQLGSGFPTILGTGEYPSAAPDGQRILFLDNRAWKMLSVEDGRIQPLGVEVTSSSPLSAPKWSRDGRYVAILETLPTASRTSQPLQIAPSVSVVDLGAVADERRNTDSLYGESLLRIVDVQTSQQVVIKNPGEFVNHGDWGVDHEYYFVALKLNWAGERAHTVLKRVKPEEPRPEEIYRIDDAFLQSAAPVISPDGKYIALSMDIDNQRREDFLSLTAFDLQSRSLKRLTTDISVGYGVGAETYEWTPDGRALFFSARNRGFDQIYQVNLEGLVTPITRSERFHFGPLVSRDGGWIAYETRDGYGRNDIRVQSLRTKRESVVATLDNPFERFRFGDFRRIRWPSSDGLSISGYLILPPDFTPKRRYPLYVDVHGGGPGISLVPVGPLSIAPSPLEWHAWAALGYVVFVPDMRSSGEYGSHIAAERYRRKSWDTTWGIVKDAEDVDVGVRWLLDQGFIDPTRVALFGHSAGGARANYLLTTSSLYRAGILHDPIPAGSLLYLVGLTSGKNTGLGFDESPLGFGSRFKDDPTAYAGGFLFDGYRYTAPTLILVGNPERGALEPLSMEVLFSMLRQYGIPARMLRYADDGHTPSTGASALNRFREIKRWLDTYIPSAEQRVAEQIFVQGDILTGEGLMSGKPKRVSAIAIWEGKVLATGSDEEILRFKGADTSVINLQGAFAMPGFNDAHLHLAIAGMAKLQVNLIGVVSLDEMLKRIEIAASKAEPGTWILGFGWDHTLWPSEHLPTRTDLDRVTAGNPALFERVDGHIAVANSRALEIAGFVRGIPDPFGGRIDRDHNDVPNGIVREAAKEQMEEKIPVPTDDMRRRAIELVISEALSAGLTSVQDFSTWDDFPVYERMASEGILPLRVSVWMEFSDPLHKLIQKRAAYVSKHPMLQVGMLKGFVDGSLGSHTAALHAPYEDDSNTRGLPQFEQAQLDARVVERARAGFQVGLHAIGDRAISMSLKAFSAAQEAGLDLLRPRIEHVQIISPGDFKRFSELGVIASVQPSHLITDMHWAEERLGSERARYSYAWRSMLNHQIKLAFGTDYPVESISPFRGLYAAITRSDEQGSKTYHPEERLSIFEAMHAYTQGSAFAEGSEFQKGKIVPGYLADFVVLDRDITKLAPLDLLETRVLRTVVAGRTAYSLR